MTGFYKVAVVVLSIIVVGLLAVVTQGPGQSAAPQATVTVTVDGEAPLQDPAPTSDESVNPEQDAFLTSLPRREDGDPLAKGRVDAQIVMTEWADYRCPFCSVFAEDTLPLLQPLIDDGTLRIEFRDLAIFGDDSINAAAGARAAGEQGLYWEFAGALYASLPNQGHPPVGDDVVGSIATEVGVPDMQKFQADYKNPATRAAIDADSSEAQGFGISSTPTFLIGTQVISGAQPLEVFEQVIASEIAKQD
ncbi:disulfide bond formation protein [Tessaracoccus antarcticus]|uniref:Disulfide bond formation protein n=2 Tax=Tessaracoccus antarcticus TaxID=2479848 RepID=A0A3M0G430_9ACTN|nr:disulfide bond formation protein [Tessaracoccus antarcticus]